MSLARLHAAVAAIPPGDVDGAWLRERLAFFKTARAHGLSLERILGIEPVGRAARGRRGYLLRQFHLQCFPTRAPPAAEKLISREIRRHRRRARDAPDGTPMGAILFELLNLGLPLGSRTILRSLQNSVTKNSVVLSRRLSDARQHEIPPRSS
jgi:hypothetical protein